MASTNNQVEDQSKVTFQFCSECSNLLYPQEVAYENEGGKLVYQCRTCTHDAPAASACIYRNELNSTVAATAGNIHDIGSDPTVGDYPICTMCGQEIVCEQCGEVVLEGYPCLEVEDSEVALDDEIFAAEGESRFELQDYNPDEAAEEK